MSIRIARAEGSCCLQRRLQHRAVWVGQRVFDELPSSLGRDRMRYSGPLYHEESDRWVCVAREAHELREDARVGRETIQSPKGHDAVVARGWRAEGRPSRELRVVSHG